jgi:hypothetical protein
MHRTPAAKQSFAIPGMSDESRLMIRFLLIELLLRSPLRMTHLQETLINRPYGAGRVFFLFSRHFVPGYPRSNPSGINA